MLIYNISRIIRLRQIEKPSGFLRKKGLSNAFAARIVNNRVMSLRMNDLERVCEIFNCTPNDLLQWIPDSSVHDVENHPLASLRRAQKVSNISNMLSNVPLDRLENIEKVIQQELSRPVIHNEEVKE